MAARRAGGGHYNRGMDRALPSLVLAVAVLVGCSQASAPPPPPAPAPAPAATGAPAAGAPGTDEPGAPAAPARLGQCAACHGRDGRSTLANVPDLAGREADSLLDAMTAYVDGRRDYPPMRAMLGPIRAEERAALARWYAAQPAPP